jgi:23S rRNA (adenine2503-C2)-methyltransferase
MIESRSILELSLKELECILADSKQERFHSKQIFSWIYKKGIADFNAMSDLPFDLRSKLKENFYLSSLKLVQSLKSNDGTEKLLFKLRDNNLIEAVSIPTKERVTGCVSTQVGCKFSCFFCASGLLGYKRNLTTGEMLDEVLYLKKNKLTHLVFMGMGEPLDNYDFVIKAIRIINSPEAIHIGARRITISTCGIIPGIKRLSEEGIQIELSISLHAADDKTRTQVMPVNKKYPLEELMLACKEYIKKTGRQITFEYILINGINSDLQSAKNLSTILKGLNCKVNLIPSNVLKECSIEPPNKSDILFFKNYLKSEGINVTLRKPRGEDIEAACGQLRLRYENE